MTFLGPGAIERRAVLLGAVVLAAACGDEMASLAEADEVLSSSGGDMVNFGWWPHHALLDAGSTLDAIEGDCWTFDFDSVSSADE